MKQKHIKEPDLLLYALNDLSEGDKDKIDRHLDRCDECKRALEAITDWHSLLSRIEKPRPDQAALKRSRNVVTHAIEKKASVPAEGRRSGKRAVVFQILLRPAAAVAILFLGILLGRSMNGSSGSDTPLRSIENAVPISRFDVFPGADRGGRIEIHFQSMQKNIISGDINDPEILVALSYMLVNEPRDNIRLKAIDLLKPYASNSGVQNALLHALDNDRNTGIRLKAIQILKSLPFSGRIKESMVSALFNDKNQRVRMEAALALSKDPDPENLAILKRHARDDDFTRAMLLKVDAGTLAIEREE
jgi:hypothetical protein